MKQLLKPCLCFATTGLSVFIEIKVSPYSNPLLHTPYSMFRSVKRHQMVFDFAKTVCATPTLQDGFWLADWAHDHIIPHADILHRSFRDDLDGAVFATFRNYELCRLMMEVMTASPLFLPAATLLIAHGEHDGLSQYVANIQGLQISAEIGAIQNVGVLPEYRRNGLGKVLIQSALQGFKRSGIQRVTLEVTAENTPAVMLYQQQGFTTFNTYFKEVAD